MSHESLRKDFNFGFCEYHYTNTSTLLTLNPVFIIPIDSTYTSLSQIPKHVQKVNIHFDLSR